MTMLPARMSTVVLPYVAPDAESLLVTSYHGNLYFRRDGKNLNIQFPKSAQTDWVELHWLQDSYRRFRREGSGRQSQY